MSIPKKIRLGNKNVGEGEPVFLVAEIANAHNGSIDTAKHMIDELRDSGVDSIKFQLHIVEAEMISEHPKFHTQKQRSLSLEELKVLKKYTEDRGMYFLCTPFSREAADQLELIGVDAFKIGSGELTDLSMIEYIAKKGKTMILSTGMSELSEIDATVAILKKYNTPFMLLHAVSVYPPAYEQLNLGVITTLRERYEVPIGLSDHTPEIYSAIAAVPLKAAFIEKHYTLDRNQSGTSDHKVSLEPHEWKELASAVRKIEKACSEQKIILPEEKKVIDWARHAVVALTDIEVGTTIETSMVGTKRPLWDGIPASELAKVIGRKTKRTLKADTLIKWTDLE